MSGPALYGVMAEFNEPEHFLEAIRRTRAAGYERMDAYSPNPIEGLDEAMRLSKSPVSLIVLIGALTGAVTGYFLQYYAAVLDFPINVGGRPLNSWVSFIPITFELTVLFACLSSLCFGILGLNGLPQPYHPVFNVPQFGRASRDRFFVCIESEDAQFDATDTRLFLEGLDPLGVYDVLE
ncbi:MAG TPA: DUF3341 domain-containing protein [Bryobacteraceae bacterium]|nr:DUF3341 domain-containing protein [Bryobacteraceae bacterium]